MLLDGFELRGEDERVERDVAADAAAWRNAITSGSSSRCKFVARARALKPHSRPK